MFEFAILMVAGGGAVALAAWGLLTGDPQAATVHETARLLGCETGSAMAGRYQGVSTQVSLAFHRDRRRNTMEIVMSLPNLPVRVRLEHLRPGQNPHWDAPPVLLPAEVMAPAFPDGSAPVVALGMRELDIEPSKLRLLFTLAQGRPRHGLELALELRQRVLDAVAKAEARLVQRTGGPFRETVSTDALEATRARWRDEIRRT